MSYAKPKRNVSKQRNRTLEGQAVTMSLNKARLLTQTQPSNPVGWKQLGVQLSQAGDLQSALEALQKAQALANEDAEVLAIQGRIMHQLGDIDSAIERLKQAVAIWPEYAKAHNYLGYIFYSQARFDIGLEHAERACELAPDDTDMLNTLANILAKRFEYSRAKETLERAAQLAPERYLTWNNLGNVLNEMGDFEGALKSYQRAHRLQPSATGPFSNLITSYHYHPDKDAGTISALCKRWSKLFSQEPIVEQYLGEKRVDKKLRVGLISGGFRGHPVGRMITSALERVSADQVELFFYSTNNASDAITQRLKTVASQWRSVQALRDTEVAKTILSDEVDIMIDLAGHNSDNRIRAISMRPAPLQVKWVGGLINTTGVETIDYLLSDHVETPEGVDEEYVEKIVRLPDDYICYDPPCGYEPEVGPLPALRNGYVTLGCFNNATKLNDVLLGEWAKILNDLPNSRLFLKSMQYQSKERCKKIIDYMMQCGIGEDRLIIEGPSPHAELLDAYNRVDIALDPWPYSGGLTTCEAFLMGVPVVTMPGPTFAGRHSATHLVNAGMPELVTSSWSEYRNRVIELAADLDSLSTIRKHLRDVLLESPVCDANRFAKHFTITMRAIWQRYCEGKEPAALSFDNEGKAWFEDESNPVEIVYAPELLNSRDKFNWKLYSKIIAIDNGGKLLRQHGFDRLLSLNAFGLVAFDPTSRVTDPGRFESSQDVQLFSHAVLGDGQPTTLYACLDPAFSSTLEPLPVDQQTSADAQGARVLTQLSINTVSLDSIEGLESLDWLILDDLNDAITILEHGKKALADTLLIQVRVAFQPTHRRQPSLAELQHWMARHGFRLYRLNDEAMRSYFPDTVPEEKRQASELVAADVIFLPSLERMAVLSNEQLTKLAFLLHTVYDIKDMAYALLVKVDEEQAGKYWAALDCDERHQKTQSAFLSSETGQAKQVVREVVSNEAHQKTEVITELVNVSCERMPAQSSVIEKPRAVKEAPCVKGDDLWSLNEPVHVVDVGANPIDGAPPYADLLKRGLVKLVGFEPQKDALQKLQAMKGPNETYLPHAVGTGEKAKLYLCQASGMTSTLKPNNEVLDYFQGYPLWGKVKAVEEIDTVRLDDVSEIDKIDWLKIDIQGGELNVFKNAENKLKNALVIQTEVNFIQLYEGQPLFAEIDQWMRAHGFMLHTLLEQRVRLYAPMKINGGIHQGINQLTTADAVYIKDINKLDGVSEEGVKKLAFIMHEAYGSYDLSLSLLKRLRNDYGKSYAGKINKTLPIRISVDKGLSNKPDVRLNYCFVVGCGHTGTTLMASILGQNESVYTIKRETGWFLGEESFAFELTAEESMAKSLGSKWLCEKTPRHVYYYHDIVNKFTGAKFVVMTRCARDVVASIKNRTGDFDSALLRWVEDNQEAVKVASANNAILVRYEDLVSDAERILSEVCDFLGLIYTPSMLDFHKSNYNWFGVMPKQTDGKGEKAHLERRAWQMTQPLQDRRGVWKNILTDEEVRIVDQAARELMVKLGYDV
ncbi:FkbM family methyltransferase [Billgrantia antri]|uniref:protein O-GlcNAc transferase n=1 Tax=Billgrantia antri TaxID=2846777 RepID=A0ABS6ZMU4_9GAMM|nr:FkbM family methyltransferase [Halomonas antri]MBW6391407.1 FkbM family methyltransferase [Halomonas antri]